MTNPVRKALQFFFHFHRGTVNITLHVLGFALLIYAVFMMDWILFSVSLILIESGHIYNHIAKIEPYDFRPHVCFWRVTIFCGFVFLVYYISRYTPPPFLPIS